MGSEWMGNAAAATWALLGSGAYVLLYFNHERIWNDRPLPLAPTLLRRLLRRGEGPLFALAVATELWGVTQSLVGGLVYLGFAQPRMIVEVGLVSTCTVIGVGIVIDLSRRNIGP